MIYSAESSLLIQVIFQLLYDTTVRFAGAILVIIHAYQQNIP